MMSTVEQIVELMKGLPDDVQNEVADFVEFLRERRRRPLRTKLRLDWIGALKDLKGEYTSVELQHKASEWRIGKALTRH